MAMARGRSRSRSSRKEVASTDSPSPLSAAQLGVDQTYTFKGVSAIGCTQQDKRRFKWVIEQRRYERPRSTPAGGPPFQVQRGERWLDVGAHKGYFALRALAQGASCFCVEAEEHNFETLCRNLLQYSSARQMRALVVPPSMSGGCKPLKVSRKNTRHSLFEVPEGAAYSGETQVVPTSTTLGMILGAHGPFDAVKMNIEGAENDVLATVADWGAVKKLVFEYSFDVWPDLALYDSLVEALTRQGWAVHPEAIPKKFREDGRWDRTVTRANDARLIWCFR
mmetsp:Transcript_26778/g.59134  ORF Transcript_26778/g.59134 Transcript_26778/m.59134 type:complete len:280 (+) Transcript_26778:26-865(+)|eukprot:CAMPEP_0204284892 /NCGR_PEP_ID=MMETSP0468-20130131/49470_1 /ASSEMBLY_ACC=CAM_ASM_000383 /TAXON_ID=2969 /ORGANISM="Oxyrrhis marina" /LENGTH=279 /DNA_ID=CAMNT_0051262669 /DNA_START=21 /DNA_END=860 /DNA_ORIENTATION=-